MTAPRNNHLMRLPRQFDLPVLRVVTANNTRWEFILDDKDHMISSSQLRNQLADQGISNYYIVYLQLEDMYPADQNGVVLKFMPHRFVARIKSSPGVFTTEELNEAFQALVYAVKYEVDRILDLDEAAETLPHVGRVFANDRNNHPRATTATAVFEGR